MLVAVARYLFGGLKYHELARPEHELHLVKKTSLTSIANVIFLIDSS